MKHKGKSMNQTRYMIYNLVICVLINTIGLQARHFSSDPFFHDLFCPNKSPLWGSIQFPKNVQAIPDIRIYYSGQRIKYEIDHDLKRINFAIPDEAQKTQYRLIITDHLEFESEGNVIKYLKVKEKTSYKYYLLEREQPGQSYCFLEKDDADITSPSKKKWTIKQVTDGLVNYRIPDDAIIICCNPSYIGSLKSMNTANLPTIEIRSDILKVTGSEKKLHEFSDELILSLIDYDTIHAAAQQEDVRPSSNPKTILTITT